MYYPNDLISQKNILYNISSNIYLKLLVGIIGEIYYTFFSNRYSINRLTIAQSINYGRCRKFFNEIIYSSKYNL